MTFALLTQCDIVQIILRRSIITSIHAILPKRIFESLFSNNSLVPNLLRMIIIFTVLQKQPSAVATKCRREFNVKLFVIVCACNIITRT